ncbi:MAG: pentapeptide repeat-containing protein [Planctomycetes bacterium]|nr:pentapeptide repeat-containing protein [Planctomycetota bacterium]
MAKGEKPRPWKEARKDIKHRWTVPFVRIERCCEWISYGFSRLAFFEILKHACHIAIIAAVIVYFAGGEGRRKVKHYQAWQVINTAQGKPGTGGRVDAIQDLLEDGVSLRGVDLSKANINGINIEGADLILADFSGAFLASSNLAGAFLVDTNCREADLRFADLTRADCWVSDFTGANFSKANLTGASFVGTNLTRANFYGANLTGTDFTEANLTEANLREANLTGAFLGWADLNKTDIEGIDYKGIEKIQLANIFGVKNPPEGFIKWAKEHGAVSFENDEEWKSLIQKQREAENNDIANKLRNVNKTKESEVKEE